MSPIVGEDTIEALLAEFPATELDRPATEGFVRAEIAQVKTDIAALRTELKSDIADVREDLLRLDVTFSERLRQQTMWMTGILVAAVGVAAAVARLVG